MDYKRVYSELMNRAKQENRQRGSDMYFERHHIIPDFMFKERSRSGISGHLPGSSDVVQNLVLLTTREHLIAHLLLCKILHKTRYHNSALTSLFLMMAKFDPRNSSRLAVNRNDLLYKSANSRMYQKLREEGVKAISRVRSGTMPCRDVETGKIVGSFKTDHPLVLSGRYVHHSKGKRVSEDTKEKNSLASSGLNNSNSSGITNEYILNEFRSLTIKLKEIPSLEFFRRVFNVKNPKSPLPKYLTKFRFNHGRDLAVMMAKEFGYPLQSPAVKKFSKLNPENYT